MARIVATAILGAGVALGSILLAPSTSAPVPTSVDGTISSNIGHGRPQVCSHWHPAVQRICDILSSPHGLT